MSQIEIPSRETGPEAPEQPAVHSNTEQPAADTGINQVEPQEKPQERETPPRQPEQPENKEKQDDAPPAPKDQEQAADLLKDKSLDIADFEREFMAQGALSEESYKRLTEAGIPKSVVDSCRQEHRRCNYRHHGQRELQPHGLGKSAGFQCAEKRQRCSGGQNPQGRRT